MSTNLLKRVLHNVKDFIGKQDRGTMVEYIIVVVVIAIGALGWLKNIKNANDHQLNGVYNEVMNLR